MFYYLLSSLRNGYIKGLLISELLEDEDRLLECPPSMLKISDEITTLMTMMIKLLARAWIQSLNFSG